jgi:PAS domain-containing protein
VSEPLRLERVVRGEAALIDRRVRERTARIEHTLERLHREKADLAQREARYRHVFHNAPVGIFLATPEGLSWTPTNPWPVFTATTIRTACAAT